jgi:hypothetical protein
MTRVVVAQLYRVVHDGAAFPPGAIATMPDDVAQRWLRAGWVVTGRASAAGDRAYELLIGELFEVVSGIRCKWGARA